MNCSAPGAFIRINMLGFFNKERATYHVSHVLFLFMPVSVLSECKLKTSLLTTNSKEKTFFYILQKTFTLSNI